ncbi:NAD(P)-dependent oxidoreductase [Micromonospora auratinigra]|uniref:Putative NADH-flavin reductase n=1 Tax=Micromonospora auratinigra TaxID=261654 RepID=A0A1A8ZIF7_9ACTN|nr:NAD(P)H-binding protein [Micromonospora auratinigra]SBT43649.1 Putative NADH-flavin reductase [Micromonospora auratinigra]
MRVVVFGATGGTGQELVRQALDGGHRVTAVVREPGRLPVRHTDLTVVTAEVSDPAALEPVVRGHDAALSALGAPTNKQAGIASRATASMLAALRSAGVDRFLAVSAAPVGAMPDDEPVLSRAVIIPLVRRVFRDIYLDLAKMEDLIHAEDLAWTVLRPPRLLDRPRSGRYRQVIGANVPGGSTIGRADLAHAMLDMIPDAATIRQVVGVAY